MNDLIIKAVDLTKIYRLYRKPHFRFLDMFGLLRDSGAYTEHCALNRVNLEIRRGERVAFIGRNGAGKSTLLKLATNITEPTSGTITIAEGASALLQIGAGFHPDFTGRENIASYLAHLGITGRDAAKRIQNIVEFSELEEYIDQPIKTYSTGMVARLMFSTSTSIRPRLLVLDEILGVGDAYFSQKSYERIKELCIEDGTTVLLVSHDVYSAARLCERMVWIDAGRVMIDGPSALVIKAYEDSIRSQEETRLRKRKQLRLAELQSRIDQAVILELYSEENQPLPASVYFSSIRIEAQDEIAELPLTSESRPDDRAHHLVLDHGCWGRSVEWEGRKARPMLDHGSSFHKVAGVFMMKSRGSSDGEQRRKLVIDYWPSEGMRLHARLFVHGKELEGGMLSSNGARWTRFERDMDQWCESPSRLSVNTRGVHGTGTVSVDDVRVIGSDGRESYLLMHGCRARIAIDYRIRRPEMRERVQVLLALQLNGVTDVCRLIARDLELDAKVSTIGTIHVDIPRLWLGKGHYQISMMIAREGYYDGEPSTFYSINPDVYACLGRVVDLEVGGGGALASGTGVVLTDEVRWCLAPRDLLTEPIERQRAVKDS